MARNPGWRTCALVDHCQVADAVADLFGPCHDLVVFDLLVLGTVLRRSLQQIDQSRS
jgi:hypothetical protein